MPTLPKTSRPTTRRIAVTMRGGRIMMRLLPIDVPAPFPGPLRTPYQACMVPSMHAAVAARPRVRLPRPAHGRLRLNRKVSHPLSQCQLLTDYHPIEKCSRRQPEHDLGATATTAGIVVFVEAIGVP